jgi:hypothetical protein
LALFGAATLCWFPPSPPPSRRPACAQRARRRSPSATTTSQPKQQQACIAGLDAEIARTYAAAGRTQPGKEQQQRRPSRAEDDALAALADCFGSGSGGGSTPACSCA